MTEPHIPEPLEQFPETADDDYPERARYPEPEEPALPSDDGYVGVQAVGTTVEEQIEGESLDAKVQREVPEQVEDGQRPLDVDEARDDLDADDDLVASDLVLDGSLVQPDEGAHGDAESDEVASLADTDGPGSAEETAMHLDPSS